jgi:hypothetical protein
MIKVTLELYRYQELSIPSRARALEAFQERAFKAFSNSVSEKAKESLEKIAMIAKVTEKEEASGDLAFQGLQTIINNSPVLESSKTDRLLAKVLENFQYDGSLKFRENLKALKKTFMTEIEDFKNKAEHDPDMIEAYILNNNVWLLENGEEFEL